MRYVALLRAIGPLNPNQRNDKLRGVVESLGYGDVQTVISTGNVLFDADTTDVEALQERIEAEWPAQLDFHSTTIIRSRDEIRALIDADPFEGRPDDATERLEVTFLKHAQEITLDEPGTFEANGEAVVAAFDRAICSVSDSTQQRTGGLMRRLEKLYGKEISTRTWRTVHRIAAKMG